MNKQYEQQVRERAYAIWEREGRSGDPREHWAQAEQELAGTIINSGKSSEEKAAEDKITRTLGDFA